MMRTLKENLLPAIRFLTDIASKRTTMPYLTHFRLEAANGRLSIRATDLDQDSTFQVECNGSLPACCVSARQFSHLIESAADGILLEMDGTKLRIESAFVAMLPTIAATEYPSPFFREGKAQGIPVADLASAIEAVSWARTDDDDRYALQGVHVKCSPNQIYCEASDGKTLGLFQKTAIAVACELLIHGPFLKRFIAALKQPEAVLLTSEGCVCVRHKGGEYSARLMNTKYPGTRRITGAGMKLLGDVTLEEIREHVWQCVSICTDMWPRVSLTFSAAGCEVKLMDSNTSYIGNVSGEFTPVTFETDGKRLLKALKSFNGTAKAKALINEDMVLVFRDGDYSMFITGLERKTA